MTVDVLWVVLAYLVGSIPTGVLLTRNRYGLDVREMGSGNIGATNVTRVFGWSAGILVFLIDVLKAAIPVWGFVKLGYEPLFVSIIGIAIVIGHCFSVFLKFKGGKGVASSFGVLLILVPWGALVGGIVYGILLAVTRISAIGSLGGMLSVFIYLWVMSKEQAHVILIAFLSAIVLIQHRSNLVRLWQTFQEKRK